jgi:hypothetical protein
VGFVVLGCVRNLAQSRWLDYKPNTVPIANVSEFEAVCSQAIIAIEKELVQVGDKPRLKEAKRDLQKLEQIARDPAAAKAFRARLSEAAETLRVEMSKAESLHEDLWDLLDFIDYCM